MKTHGTAVDRYVMAAGDTAAVKKNLIVLLAIAFVIAVAATGLFYGLFADKFKDSNSEAPKQTVIVTARALERGAVLKRDDVRTVEVQGPSALRGAVASPDEATGKTLLAPLGQGAPVLEAVLVSSGQSTAGLDDVPPGMRAVTLHVVESGSIVPLLHSGSRVDIQAVYDRSGVTELRRVLQDVEVLSTGSAEPAAGRNLLPQVTVLVRPEQADVAALADTGSRVRLVLRNRQDHAGVSTPSLNMTALFQGPIPAQPALRPASTHSAPAVASAPVPAARFHVRIVAATPPTLLKLGAESATHSWRVLAFQDSGEIASSDTDLADSDVSFGPSDTAIVRAGTSDCTLRIKLHLGHDLKISPELIWREGDGTRTASLEAHVDPGSAQGFVIAGFNSALAGVLARAFPARNLDGRELAVTIVQRHEQAFAHR